MRAQRIWGSPPRGRGKGAHAETVGCAVGITPAWAGKRATSWPNAWLAWDHPRVGGEKVLQLPVFQSPLGSPPHRRGKGGKHPTGGTHPGITPA